MIPKPRPRDTVPATFIKAVDARVGIDRAWPHSEHALQVHLIQRVRFLETQQPDAALLFAVPNGGARHKAVAGKLKAEGVKTGVPDLCLPVARGLRIGLFLELKKAGTSPSAEQWNWLFRLHLAGHHVRVANDPDTAFRIIADYLAS